MAFHGTTPRPAQTISCCSADKGVHLRSMNYLVCTFVTLQKIANAKDQENPWFSANTFLKFGSQIAQLLMHSPPKALGVELWEPGNIEPTWTHHPSSLENETLLRWWQDVSMTHHPSSLAHESLLRWWQAVSKIGLNTWHSGSFVIF